MKNIYTITPSWALKNKNEFNTGIKNIEKLGFAVLNKSFSKNLLSPRLKAEEINKAFKNKDVDIILARRGGYSSMKALPFIDFNLIRKNPKIFAGFSDVSTLLNSIYEKTGLTTFHSPMVINFEKPPAFTLDSFMNITRTMKGKDLFKGAPVEVYNRGTQTGILKGGNLVTLTALISTGWEIRTKGSMLFFEDVDEKLHQIDRYFTQWILAGKFKGLKGLILGDFRGSKTRNVYDIIKSQMKITFPVVACPYIGHVKNKITLPVGARVLLDTRTKQLKVL
ncbi:MAG: LD-carboxypeptidase [Elusimicrobia bacterium]|nr:LD-carboxypeptidase [Candidatus Liberimonas magnetica]